MRNCKLIVMKNCKLCRLTTTSILFFCLLALMTALGGCGHVQPHHFDHFDPEHLQYENHEGLHARDAQAHESIKHLDKRLKCLESWGHEQCDIEPWDYNR